MSLLLKILAGLLAVLGTVATLDALPFLDPTLGLVIIGAAGALYGLVKFIGDYLDDKLLNDSFKEDGAVKKILDFLKGLIKK